MLIIASGLVAGCGSSGPGGSATSAATTRDATTATTRVESTSGPSSSTGSTSTASTTTSTTPGTSGSERGRCRAADLDLLAGQTQGAAGKRYLQMFLINTSDTSCTLYGYPGVALRDASGRRVGAPATRDPGFDQQRVTLTPGGRARFMVHTTAQTGTRDCDPPAPIIQVIPPNSTTRMTVRHEVTICLGRFGVSPVTPPSGPTTH